MAKQHPGLVASWRKGGGWRVPRWRRGSVVLGASLLLLAALASAPQANDVLGISQPLTVLLQSLEIAAVPLAGMGLLFLCIAWWVGNQAMMLGAVGVAALGGLATKAQTAETLLFGVATGAEVFQTDAWHDAAALAHAIATDADANRVRLP